MERKVPQVLLDSLATGKKELAKRLQDVLVQTSALQKAQNEYEKLQASIDALEDSIKSLEELGYAR